MSANHLVDRGADVDHRDAGRELIVADVLGVPGADAPELAPAPATKRAVLLERAGVLVARDDVGNGRTEVPRANDRNVQIRPRYSSNSRIN